MKIKYNKKKQRINMIIAIVWFVFAIGQVFIITFKEGNWTNYSWLVLALMNIGNYLYQYINQYLTLINGKIKENYPFGKNIYLIDIKGIKKFAGDYILKTDKTELTINTQIIEPKSLEELNMELEKLKLDWR